MYCTYILESELNGQLYIGQTNDVNARFIRHNKGFVKSTRSKRPWKLVFFVESESRAEAVQLEIKLKAFKNPAKVREWIRNFSKES